ncbi:MAG: hypothetical protein LH466_09290, partial [Sphingomonas bacterium]|nr:hypothetical protein [Sphingomonas bacterium]
RGEARHHRRRRGRAQYLAYTIENVVLQPILPLADFRNPVRLVSSAIGVGEGWWTRLRSIQKQRVSCSAV